MKISHTTTSARSARLFLVAGIALASAAVLYSSRADAASQTWDGGAGTNILNTATNWTNDALPTTALDTATFGNLASGTLQWNASFGPTTGNSGGVNISYTGSNALTLDATNTTAFGLGDITLAAGAGIFTLGDGTGTSTMTIRDPSMQFTNDSSNTSIAKSDVVFGNGGGSPRTITVSGSGNWTFETPLFSVGFGGLSTSALTKSGNGTLTLGTQNFHQGGTTVSAGIILATASSALGAGTVSLPNPSGRVQLSGGITLPNAFSIPGQNQGDIGKIENLSGNNTLSGGLTWNSTGGLFTNITSTSGTLTLTGNLTTAGGVTGDRTFQFGGSGDTVSSGTISNGVATTLNVLKSGAGTLTLSGSNSYNGTTTLAAGRLALGSANAIGSSGTIAFSGGSLQYSASNTTDYSARFSSAASQQYSIDTNGQNVTLAADLASSGGSFTKLGSGSLTLSGSNSYTAGTVVSAGRLIGTTTSLQGAITNNSAVEFAQTVGGAYSGVMGGSGSLTKTSSGTVTLSGSNSYAGGTIISAGRLIGTTTSLQGTITNNAEAEFAQATSGTFAGSMTGSGSLTKSGVGAVALTGSNGFTGGAALNAGTLAVGSVNALGSSGTISFGGGTLQYSASNTTDYSARFSNAASQQYSIDTNGQNVTLAADFTSSGGSFTKLGAGALTLSGSNSYSGATSLAAGRVVLGSANALGGTGLIAFSGGTLQFTASNTSDYSARIASGTSAGSISVDTNGQDVTFGTSLTSNQSGGLTKAGSGTLVLKASNAFGGNTTVSGGNLGVQNSNALSNGSVSVGAARVQLSGGISLLNNFALAGAVNGPNDSLSFSRIENLSDNNTIAGNITWNQTGGTYTNITSTVGTLTLSGSLSTSGAITGDRTFNFNGNGDTIISGPISNGAATTLNVLKSGAGTLTLSGSSSYNGITTLAAGRLALGSDTAIGTVGPIAFTGGTLQYSASNTRDYSSRIASGTSTGSVAIDTNGQTVTFATGLAASQSGGLSKVGSGKLVLTASNAFGGGIAVSDGLLEVQHSKALSGGTVTTGAGRLQISGGIALANAFSLNGATNGPTDSLTFSRIENLSGNNTISGNMTWNLGGGTHTNISSSAGTLTLSGNLTTASISGSRTFNFTGSGNTIISGQISDGVGSTVGLTKNGSGSLTISGSGNTYSGPTTVTVGRLVVNGNLPSATTTVQAGATIGGNGSLGGLLAVDSGAFLAPGNSPGNLTLNAGLNLAGTYSWELAALSTSNPGGDYDTITVTAGNVDLTGATLALNLGEFAPSADAFWATNQAWNGIIANSGAGTLAGAFAAIDNSSWSSLGSFSAVSIDNDVNLVWTAVPEPGACVLAVLGAIGLGITLRRNRR